MGFRYIRRVVACTLLMVLLSNAQNQPVLHAPSVVVAANSDSSCCSVARLEARLTSIERRQNDMQKSIASLNDPLLSEYCAVDLASCGFDDSTKHGYVKTSAATSDVVLGPQHRGVTLFELDATKCTTKNRQHFDTYEFAEARVQLLETLESATAGTIIVGVTVDTPEKSGEFQNDAGSFFTRYNMNIAGLQVRDKFAFIMQIGYPKKTVFHRRPRYGESLKVKVLLSGSTVSDVTFKQV